MANIPSSGHPKDEIRSQLAPGATDAVLERLIRNSGGIYKLTAAQYAAIANKNPDHIYIVDGVIQVNQGPQPLAISGTPDPVVKGQAYSFTPTVTGGSGTKRYSLRGSLPQGMTFDTVSGIGGTPSSGTSTRDVYLTVTDDTGSVTLGPLFFGPAPSSNAIVPQSLALADNIAFLGCSVDFDTNWNGLVPALIRRMNYRLQPNPYGYFGWPGTRPDEWLIQLPGLLATKPQALWIGDWVNSLTSGTSYSLQSQTSVIENIMQQYGALPTSKTIILTTTRKTDNVVTAGRVALLDQINAWCAAQDGRVIGYAKVKFLDAPYDITTGGPDTLCTRDKTHDNTRGAIFNRGKKYFDLLSPILPSGRVLPISGTPPVGNLSTNPLFTGSSTLTATGAGAANVSGTISTGYAFFSAIASGVTVVADATGNRQRFTISGNQPGTSDMYMTVTVPGLLRGKKYIFYLRHQISAADGTSSATTLRNLSVLPATIPIGSDGKGPLITGDGDIPTPYRGTTYPINPITGLADDVGEPWLVGRPVTCPISGSNQFRVYITPFAGAVDIMIDFTDFFVVEFVEPKMQPYYQAQRYARGDGTFQRFYPQISGVYTAGGNFPTGNTTTRLLSFSAAQANGSWVLQPGDFSGGIDSYDGTVEVQKSGQSTWTTVVSSILTANWTWNATGYGLATGDSVRISVVGTVTGIGNATAIETVTIT